MSEERALAPQELFQERVKERLRGDIGTLLPDEMLDEMIRRSVQEMIGRVQKDPYGRPEKSWFDRMVEDRFNVTVNAAVQRWLTENEAEYRERVAAAIAEQGPRMLAEMLLAALRNQTWNLSQNVLPQLLENALRGGR